MKFHVTELIPPRRDVHGLYGYREPIDAVCWGLAALGHDVTRRTNRVVHDRTNIVFGIQMADEMFVDALPPDTIVYQLEQMGGLQPHQIKPAYRTVARRLRVWDYSAKNLAAWQRLRPARPPVVVPVGWAPVLARISRVEPEDIDVLFYGWPGDARFRILRELCAAGASCVFACGLYGESRDALIARARLVLNINRYAHSRIFEVVRTSYLLANEKAVVADLHPETYVEPDLQTAVAFAPLEQVTGRCLELLDDSDARQALAKRGEEIFRQRDIREILRQALAASGCTAS